VAASVGFAGCKKNDHEPEPVPTPEETITTVTEKLEDKPELSVFADAFKSVTLSQEEVSEGVTIFAPTNDAVSEFSQAAVSSVGKGSKTFADSASKLTEAVLKDHIIRGVLALADLTNGKTFTSITGKQYKILRSGDTVRINGVLLNIASTGTNEMIYTVNKILTNSKVTDTVNNPIKACKIDRITYSGDDYQTYQYDSQNRIVKISDYYQGTIDEEFTYTYSDTQIIKKIYEEGELLETLTYHLANGRPSSSTTTEVDTITDVTTDSTGNQTTKTSVRTTVRSTTFQHNAEGFLTQKIETNNITQTGNPTYSTADTSTYTYFNGNLNTEVYTSGPSKVTKTYEYYTDKTNTLPVEVDDDEFLLTKPSKNPPKKITTAYKTGTDTSTYVSTITYTYDSEGLITKGTFAEGQQSYSTDFLYNCK